MKKAPFKLKSGNNPDKGKLSGAAPTKLIYGKKKTSVDASGATTTTRKNLLTGGTKTTTKYSKKGIKSLGTAEGSETTKIVQRSNKSKSKIRVKKKVTSTLPDFVPGKKKTFTTTTKTKFGNRKGTDDYKIKSQSVKEKGAFGRGKRKNTKGPVGTIYGNFPVESGFKDPRD